MPAPTKLLLALATVIFLCVALASAQTSSSSGAVPIATDVCEACRDGNCASGVQFCENGNSNSSRLCCCPESAICVERTYTTAATTSTEVCMCLSPLFDTLQTNFLIPSGVSGASGANSKHGMTTATWVFLGIGVAFIAALIAFTIYYKIKKRQNQNNQQVLLETSV